MPRLHPLHAIVPLAALVALAAPWAAVAETEPQRFTWHPKIELTGIASDNLRHDENDREEDLGGWISPGLELAYRDVGWEVGVDAAADLRRYVETSGLAEEFGRVAAWAEVGLMPGLSLRITDDYEPLPRRLGVPEDDTSNLVQANRAAAALVYVRELEGGRELQLGLSGARLDGDDFTTLVPAGDGATAVADRFETDYWEGAAHAELGTPMGERTTAFFRSDYRYRAWEESGRADYSDVQVQLGVRSRRIRDVELSLSAGYGYVGYAGKGDTHAAVGEASLLHHLPAGFRWRASVGQRLAPDLLGNDFVELGARLGVEKRFGNDTQASIDGFFTRLDESSFARAGIDLFGGVEVKVDHQLTERAAVSLAYRHWNNGGSDDLTDFAQNRLALRVGYRY